MDSASRFIPGSAGLRDRSLYFPLEADPFICVPGFTLTFNSILINFAKSFRSIPDYFVYNNSSRMHFLSHDKLLPLAANIYGIQCHINEPLAAYRQHSFNLSGSHRPVSVRERLKKSYRLTSRFYYYQCKCAVYISRAIAKQLVHHNSLPISDALISNYLEKSYKAIDFYRQVARLSLCRYYIHSTSTDISTARRLSMLVRRLLNPSLLQRKASCCLDFLIQRLLCLLCTSVH